LKALGHDTRHLLISVAPGALKRGANVPDDVWGAIRREMMEARSWP